MRIIVNRRKAARVFGRLLKALERNEYPYNLSWVKPPQIDGNLPRNLARGTREHALFLFCLCYYMRGGIKSDTATRSLGKLYGARPEMFLPERVDELRPEDVTSLLREVGLGFKSEEIGMSWVKNFERLRDQWWANPVELFRGVRTYDEACARIMNDGKRGTNHLGFYGFRHKMVSMLTYFFMDAGFLDPFHFPIPVDFHVLRICLAHELVRVEYDPGELNGDGFYIEVLLAEIRDLVEGYCRRRRMSPLRLCEVLWLLSRSLCAQYPGNLSRVVHRSARKSETEPVPLTWNKSQTSAYLRSCGSCPVRATCRYCVPSATYYIQGKLVLRGERTAPPHLLPGLID